MSSAALEKTVLVMSQTNQPVLQAIHIIKQHRSFFALSQVPMILTIDSTHVIITKKSPEALVPFSSYSCSRCLIAFVTSSCLARSSFNTGLTCGLKQSLSSFFICFSSSFCLSYKYCIFLPPALFTA